MAEPAWDECARAGPLVLVQWVESWEVVSLFWGVSAGDVDGDYVWWNPLKGDQLPLDLPSLKPIVGGRSVA